MTYTFKKKYEFEGKEYEFLEINLDDLKGSDIAAVKKQFTAGGGFSALPSADSEFCALILARITKQPIDFFNNLPANDYCALTQQVSNFLLA